MIIFFLHYSIFFFKVLKVLHRYIDVRPFIYSGLTPWNIVQLIVFMMKLTVISNTMGNAWLLLTEKKKKSY